MIQEQLHLRPASYSCTHGHSKALFKLNYCSQYVVYANVRFETWIHFVSCWKDPVVC